MQGFSNGHNECLPLRSVARISRLPLQRRIQVVLRHVEVPHRVVQEIMSKLGIDKPCNQHVRGLLGKRDATCQRKGGNSSASCRVSRPLRRRNCLEIDENVVARRADE